MSLCWQSVLLRTVQELTFPERAENHPAGGEPPTQLEAFAHGVLAHLIAGLIEAGRVEHPEPAGAAAWLRSNPVEAFSLADAAHPWAHWLRVVFEHFHREMEGELRRAGLQMQSPGWLRVLFRYAASRPEDEARTLGLAWFQGQALEPDEAKALGLRAGENTPADTPDQINELCWRRLMDFCQLAAFYRPFVFCFDQTEAYGHAPGLARCFGTVVAQIHLLAPNQMMVVTANQQPWEETVARHMETADKDRFVPLPLEGLNRAQAEELVRLRCKAWEVPPEQVGAFLNGGWLGGKLPTERNRMGARQFLQLGGRRGVVERAGPRRGPKTGGVRPDAGGPAGPLRGRSRAQAKTAGLQPGRVALAGGGRGARPAGLDRVSQHEERARRPAAGDVDAVGRRAAGVHRL